MNAVFYTERYCSVVGHNIPLLNQEGCKEVHCLWHQECVKHRGGCHNRWIFPPDGVDPHNVSFAGSRDLHPAAKQLTDVLS